MSSKSHPVQLHGTSQIAASEADWDVCFKIPDPNDNYNIHNPGYSTCGLGEHSSAWREKTYSKIVKARWWVAFTAVLLVQRDLSCPLHPLATYESPCPVTDDTVQLCNPQNILYETQTSRGK